MSVAAVISVAIIRTTALVDLSQVLDRSAGSLLSRVCATPTERVCQCSFSLPLLRPRNLRPPREIGASHFQAS